MRRIVADRGVYRRILDTRYINKIYQTQGFTLGLIVGQMFNWYQNRCREASGLIMLNPLLPIKRESYRSGVEIITHEEFPIFLLAVNLVTHFGLPVYNFIDR